MLLLQDEPGPKHRKIDKTDITVVPSTAPATLEGSKDSTAPVASGSKPLGHAQNPIAGKPVATVPPMAASKATSNTVSQPAVPTKSKVSVES